MRTSKKIKLEPSERDTTKYAAIFEKKKKKNGKKIFMGPTIKILGSYIFFYLTIDDSQTGKLLIFIKR